MKKCLTVAIAALFGIALTMPVSADVVGSGPGGPISETNPSGTITSTILIGPNETISDVEISIESMTHTWAGDLVVTLTSPNATTLSIMDGVGSAGNTGAGDSSDFGGTYDFSDNGGDLWAAAAAVDGATIIAPGDYFASDINGFQNFFASTFAGESTAGLWTLSIFDRAGGDTGAFSGWTLRITSAAAVPEPGSLALLGLFGMTCLARRRR